MKYTQEDQLVSQLVKFSSDYGCQHCGKSFKGEPELLHCSHWKGRANKSTRYHPDNVFAHCMWCHSDLEQSPAKFDRWVIMTIGEERADEINRLSKRPMKIKDHHEKELRTHFRAELKRIQAENGNETQYWTAPDWYMMGVSL